MSDEELAIIFRKNTLAANIAIGRVVSILKRHNMSTSGFLLYGKQVELEELLRIFEKTQNSAFNIIGNGFEFHLSSIGNNDLDLFAIKAQAPPRIFWDEWAAAFVADPNFVMGWIVDVDYDHWQNAKDPLEYTAMHRPYAHLPMKSNGLPPPLEQEIIDISTNPGRRQFKKGYVEAVGSIMWLGAPFWSASCADQRQVEASSWLEISHPVSSVTRIQSADRCFTVSEGNSGMTQAGLRRLLFPAQGD